MDDQGAEEYPQWSIHMDGLSNKQVGEAGVVLRSPEGDEIKCMIHLDFPTTNNEADYETLVAGLNLANVVGLASVVIHYESQVITNQVNGDYNCKGERMKKYLEQAKRRLDDLQARIVQIPRAKNKQADCLAKAALAEHMIIFYKLLSFTQCSPLIDPIDVQEIGSKNNWTTPLVSYLKNDALLDGRGTASKLKVQAA